MTARKKPAKNTPTPRPLTVQMLPIESITPYPGNPRRPNDAVRKVQASIRKYGFQQPIVVDRDMVIIVGHTRWQAAKELGLTEVPVTIADNLTEVEARAYRIEDNRTGSEATFDLEKLTIELTELELVNIDLASLGFDAGDLDKLADPAPPDPDPPGRGSRGNGLGAKVISYSLVFETEEQQAAWFDFLRALKRDMPQLETIGARLTRFIQEQSVV